MLATARQSGSASTAYHFVMSNPRLRMVQYAKLQPLLVANTVKGAERTLDALAAIESSGMSSW